MEDIGPRIARLRKRRKLSQEALATAAGISQTTVSRLEKQEQAANTKTLAKLARALDVGLTELVPPESLNGPSVGENEFFAFCENPICVRNEIELERGISTVFWKSWQQYPNSSWADVNFCRSCGNDLVKECPSCNKKFLDKGGRFCTRCGAEFTDRPTDAEWKEIAQRLEAKEKEKAEKDIPF